MIDNYIQREYRSWDRVYTHPNFQHYIYLGDLNAAQNLNFIHSHSITTVVTAALGMDHLDYSEVGVTHIVYPLLDHKHQKIAHFFQEFFNILEKKLKMGNVLVHCSAGISRSSTLVVSYIMRKQNLTFKQALQMVRNCRPRVLPNLGFQRQLKIYETQLRDIQHSSITSRNKITHTSTERRQISLIKYEQLPSVKNMMLKESPQSAKSIVTRRQTFQIRNLKLRSPEKGRGHISLSKGTNLRILNEQSEPNFSVIKVQINERRPPRTRFRGRLLLNH